VRAVKLKVSINLLTPLHVGGEPGEDANTAYILRGADRNAYYPGTAFKGKARHYALQLQEMRGIHCAFPSSCACAVCRLFGGEGNAPGSLYFSNFNAVENQATDLRAGNSIDRYRRVADDEKLFTTESAAIGSLVGHITGNVNDDCLPKDSDLLAESIKLIRQIGGNTSRGFGWVDGEIIIEDESASQSGQEITVSSKDFVSCVRVTLTPQSPLLVGTHTTQSNFRDTQCIIPGAVLRAAMARAICEQDGINDPSEEGIKTVLPVDRDTLFINLRNVFSELRFSVLNSDTQPEPYPITTRKCKFHENHKKVDTLAAIIKSVEAKCPECGGRLEKVDPYEDFDENETTVASTHSEMDKLRGTTKDGRLYTVRAIAPNTATFSGTISGSIDEGELSLLLRPQAPLRVGAMISAGFGECKASFVKDTETPDAYMKSRIIERIERFNGLIGGDKHLVPITLMSDAIVELEEPNDGDYVEAYTSLFDPILGQKNYKMVRVITKPRMWRGFDTSKKNGFEKPARFLLQAGSVFVIRVGTLDDSTIEKLFCMESKGIGKETEDGYGAVRVAHENHIDITLNVVGG
jgi:CRISPR/Cas system CSM-associated protein Csm3 (group 7 of RAMP superfamily)